MYESPIQVMQKEMEFQMENNILNAIQEVGVVVEKEELVKALQYDRNQYDKGYADGYNNAIDDFNQALFEKSKCVHEYSDYCVCRCAQCEHLSIAYKNIEELAEQLKGGTE